MPPKRAVELVEVNNRWCSRAEHDSRSLCRFPDTGAPEPVSSASAFVGARLREQERVGLILTGLLNKLYGHRRAAWRADGTFEADGLTPDEAYEWIRRVGNVHNHSWEADLSLRTSGVWISLVDKVITAEWKEQVIRNVFGTTGNEVQRPGRPHPPQKVNSN